MAPISMIKNILILLLLGTCFSANAQSDSAQIYFKKGLEEKSAKRWLVASKHFDKAVSFDPKYTEAYIENGISNLEMRKTDVAKQHFTKANEVDPSNKVAIGHLMELNYNYRQWNKAIEFAQKCSDCPGAGKIIGMSNYQLEDYVKAEKQLSDAVKANPEDAVLNYTLAKTYIEMEQYPKGYPFFKKAIELDTNKVSWMIEFADENYEGQHYKDAVIYYNKALAHGHIANNDFNTDLGFSYLYSGEYQKGESLIMAVFAKNPGKKDLLRDVADAFYNRKMYDKTLDYCQKLLELDNKDAKALYQAGLAFIKKGEKDRGQAMCDKAIEMDPSLSNLKKKMSMPEF